MLLDTDLYLPLAVIWGGPRAFSPPRTQLVSFSVYYSPVAFISFTLFFCSSLLRFFFSLSLAIFFFDHVPKVKKKKEREGQVRLVVSAPS